MDPQNTSTGTFTPPTDDQIQAEIAALFGLTDSAKATDNTDLLDAHTQVLKDRMSRDDVRSQFGPSDSSERQDTAQDTAQGDADGDFSDDEMLSLMEAAGWLDGSSDTRPSDSCGALLVAAGDEDDDEDESDAVIN